MGTNPADEKMNLLVSKGIFANHSVGVTTNIENNPI